jgi:hypothetical protein
MSDSISRMRRAILLVVCCLLLAGCKVETTLTVDVRDDGSGTVAVRVDLDAEAVREAEAGGSRLEDRIRLHDLEAAGWASTGWKRRRGGDATLHIAKDFAEPSDLPGVFAELDGADGPVRGVSLTRDKGLLFTDFRLRSNVDLSGLATGITTDPELVANLTAHQVDLAGLDLRLLGRVEKSFRLEIVAALPGETRTFAPKPGQKIQLTASSRRFDPSRTVWVVAALALAVLALAAFLGGRRAARRPRRRGLPAGPGR